MLPVVYFFLGLFLPKCIQSHFHVRRVLLLGGAYETCHQRGQLFPREKLGQHISNIRRHPRFSGHSRTVPYARRQLPGTRIVHRHTRHNQVPFPSNTGTAVRKIIDDWHWDRRFNSRGCSCHKGILCIKRGLPGITSPARCSRPTLVPGGGLLFWSVWLSHIRQRSTISRIGVSGGTLAKWRLSPQLCCSEMNLSRTIRVWACGPISSKSPNCQDLQLRGESSWILSFPTSHTIKLPS